MLVDCQANTHHLDVQRQQSGPHYGPYQRVARTGPSLTILFHKKGKKEIIQS